MKNINEYIFKQLKEKGNVKLEVSDKVKKSYDPEDYIEFLHIFYLYLVTF